MRVKNLGEPMKPMAQLRSAVARWVGYYLPRGRDLDLEQAYVRLAIASLVLCYTGYVIWTEGWSTNLLVALIAVGCLAIFAVAQIALLHRFGSNRTYWRTAAIAADVAAGTVGMAVSGEAGVPLVGIYLWVTVGNGFRFGPRYLIVSYGASLIGVLALLAFAPFWTEHRMIGVGLFLALAVVPLYVLVLLSRLQAQRDSAEQLSNAKSRFVANVSHELRTPLTGVYAVYDLLRAKKLPPDERELIGMLGKSIGTLKTSVDAILQMSKLEAGAERTENRLFNLWYLLRQLSAIVEPQAVAKRIAFQLHVDPNVPASVEGDPDHISHVLGNLLNNAFKFTHVGSVSLRALCTADDRVRFEVIDTGIGIPLEKQEHLFERFVQADNSAARRYGGTGLGTSIAHDLVQLMKGQIGVSSAPGKGSTFWVELPLNDVSRVARGAQSIAARLLVIVANSDTVRTRIRQYAEASGFIALDQEPSRPVGLPEGTCAIAVAMEPSDAATYAEAATRAGYLKSVPWFAVSTGYTSMQKAALIRAGAAALLLEADVAKTLSGTLAGLEYRVSPPDSIGAEKLAATKGIVQPLQILLADDNVSNRMLLAKILRDAGHQVVEATGGSAAFEHMATGAIDLALLDLNMPEMTGPDVTKMFRASEVGGFDKLPIVILSADATPTAKQESIEAGADDFLVKPVTSDVLLASIERVCAGHVERRLTVADQVQAPSSMGVVLLDYERLSSLRQISRGDGKFLENYIIAAFVDLEAGINSLARAISVRDERAARDALHILEGTGSSIGASALLMECKQIRACIADIATKDFAAGLAALATTYALTKSAATAALSTPVA